MVGSHCEYELRPCTLNRFRSSYDRLGQFMRKNGSVTMTTALRTGDVIQMKKPLTIYSITMPHNKEWGATNLESSDSEHLETDGC